MPLPWLARFRLALVLVSLQLARSAVGSAPHSQHAQSITAAAGQRGPPCIARRALVAGALAALPIAPVAAATTLDSYGFIVDKPERKGLQTKWLEDLRILLQDQADAVQYGGELAPGGPPSVVPGLLLIPIVQMQATLLAMLPLVEKEAEWPSMLSVVTSGPFATLEFKKIFNAYGDNIYYRADSPEANAYLLGGATPSTAQTTQYLLRNEALKQVDEFADELRYQLKQAPEKRETDVAKEYLQNLLKTFDEYLRLSPKNELELARAAVYKDGLGGT